MSRTWRVVASALAVAAAVLPAAPRPAAAVGGLVTVHTVPAVAGVELNLGGQTQPTDLSGSASFTTNDLDSARTSLQLLSSQVDSTTHVQLLHVAADPNHAIGARLLIAELAVERPVSMQLQDRQGSPVDPQAVTGMTLRSSDQHAKTVRPGDGPVWLPTETAVRGAPPPGQSHTLTYRVEGVRVDHVPVALGDISPLQPGQTSWSIPLSGYPFNVTVHTVPPVASVALRLGAETVQTDAAGAATFYTDSLDDVAGRMDLASHAAAPHIRVGIRHVTRVGEHAVGTRNLVVALDVRAAVRFSFVDVAGKHVSGQRITSVVLGGPHGHRITLSDEQLRRPVWLKASQLASTSPPRSRPVTYTVDGVSTYGTNAVFAGGQRFDPVVQSTWLVRMHLYRLVLSAHDMLFGQSSGGAVTLTAPDGSTHTSQLHGGTAVFTQVPRGEYQLAVASGARHLEVPVRVARDQTVAARVISWLDVAAILLLGVALAGSVAWFGLRARRRRMQRERTAEVTPSTVAQGGVVTLVLALVATGWVAASPAPARADSNCRPPAISTDVAPPSDSPSFDIPVWGYYYIWYTPASWHRAKIDEPQLGCYSSDDVDVMRAHIRMAKAAGLTGFLVSWKDTPVLDMRLRLLDQVARSENFQLGIVYEALDFHRNPLPASTVQRDLNWLADRYGEDSSFTAGGKPVVVWTGTEDYPTPVIAGVTRDLRRRLTVLGSAKSVKDYGRIAQYVDGDAYYWSSGDPAVASYPKRLAEMGAAVHATDGMWLAPAAPGFNARAIGGHRNIARNGGATLRLSLAAALVSSPDALGIISWNEWSENTYVEPSFKYDKAELAVLAEVLHGQVSPTVATAAGAVTDTAHHGWRAWHALLVLCGLCLVTVIAVEQRRRRMAAMWPGPPPRWLSSPDGIPEELNHRRGR